MLPHRRMFRLLLTTAAAAALATVSATLTPASLHRTSLPTFTSRTTTPTSANCHLNYFQQPLDHFGHHPTTLLQRYFWNDTYFTPNGPILYYTGNEADVTLYVNATGLMWENAQELGALLVFGEHRYYGETQPFPNAHPLTPSRGGGLGASVLGGRVGGHWRALGGGRWAGGWVAGVMGDGVMGCWANGVAWEGLGDGLGRGSGGAWGGGAGGCWRRESRSTQVATHHTHKYPHPPTNPHRTHTTTTQNLSPPTHHPPHK